jgi:surface protein
MGSMFNNAYKFDKNIGNWDTHKVNNTGAMFQLATSFDNGGSNSISGWTMSANTTIGYMFYGASNFNRDIGGWKRDTPNEYGYLSDIGLKPTQGYFSANYAFAIATKFNNGQASGVGTNTSMADWSMSGCNNMGHMFYVASSFNQPLSGWNVTNVTTGLDAQSGMRNMFNGSKFNQDISNWERITPNVSTLANVIEMGGAFAGTPFNNGGSPDISGWTTTKLVNLNNTFQGNTSFNQPIGSWDTRKVLYMGATFNGTTNFTQDISDWNVSGVTTMAQMFYNATKFSGTPNMSGWSVSNVKDMSYLFANSKFEQDISNWNVSSATTMNRMFFGTPFNNGGSPDISGWTTSAVTDMSYMFYGTTSFNQPIDNWDVSSVTTMTNMFASSVFNQPLNSWITSEVTDMSSMFDNADNFDQDLGNWDLRSLTATTGMFQKTTKFNNSGSTSISGWTTSAVTDMSVMFYLADKFNQPIGDWDVSNVTGMASMFQSAPLFNQPLSGWNTSKVTRMESMFRLSTAFNQPIGNWNVSAVTNFTNFMTSKTYLNYDAVNLTDIYTGWTSGGKTVKTGLTINFGGAPTAIKYTIDGQAGKDLLTGATPTGYAWIIVDGGVAP